LTAADMNAAKPKTNIITGFLATARSIGRKPSTLLKITIAT
jgi:hypothetical protein